VNENPYDIKIICLSFQKTSSKNPCSFDAGICYSMVQTNSNELGNIPGDHNKER